MSNYLKPTVGPAWGETAANPGDIITMTPADVQTGWTNTGTPPSRQRFNYILNWLSRGVRYFMQRGLPDYDAAETYRTNSRIIGDDGWTYRSLQDNNIGHPPSSSPSYWELWGLTIGQIDNATITQATLPTGTVDTRVANTSFVQNAINTLNANLTAYVNSVRDTLNAAINNVQNNLNNAVATLNNSINSAIGTAEAYVSAGMGLSLGSNGYFKFPNWASGLTIQWKRGATISNSGATNLESFPVPFNNACLFCSVSTYNAAPTDTAMSYFQVVSWDANNVTLYMMRNADHGFNPISPLIFAIGY
jgi:hypothetical protein